MHLELEKLILSPSQLEKAHKESHDIANADFVNHIRESKLTSENLSIELEFINSCICDHFNYVTGKCSYSAIQLLETKYSEFIHDEDEQFKKAANGALKILIAAISKATLNQI
jgi:hypothetical protein